MAVMATVLAVALGLLTHGSVRKLCVLYALYLFLRTASFTVSTPPAPCAGCPNCPCAEIPWEEASLGRNRFQIALLWTFAAGLAKETVPQCGDLIPSGHSGYILLLVFFCIEAVQRESERQVYVEANAREERKRRRLVRVYTVTLLCALAVALFSIAFIRNHYTIDVLFATFLSVGLWLSYSALEYGVQTGKQAAQGSIRVLLNAVSWLEHRPGDNTGLMPLHTPLDIKAREEVLAVAPPVDSVPFTLEDSDEDLIV
ncbi:hypothetical protein KIPB_006082 [Kipferlia bialata]|uniref:Sphingomyelin synthase-like domain-containing protein n=1 Tax=Kipferlia bialata TaxID=797122 RepID=A0A9K3CYC7_9EUKA|nr:hypothetical protein KIPB_006082 [Kipferlia bialata]|eukprot:g6082.t1